MKLKNISFLVETSAFEGVKRVAGKVAIDVEKVCSAKPNLIEDLSGQKELIFIATLGCSPLLDKLTSEGKFDVSSIKGKREVYQIKLLENPFPNVEKILLICGSDKRGTIYGTFALSEFIGVSPLHYWGDTPIQLNESIELTEEIETLSKEPSVKYRGFFINDEWPCFGNWTFSHFDGFTAKMYEHVFELLLRLKGNYIWPAMWSSSFALDGPGNLNEELADIYGVVVGASHHEPCLRASEEWDKVRGENSPYGNDWNYYTNRDGLLKYWEDGLKRSGKYERIITIGMRGERDSSMLGPNATVAENIDLLKDIIRNQRELIKKNVNPDLEEVPQMLALYKEVEEYFYGSEYVEGLKDWDELDDVICMLCEDNYGFMRTLPTEDIRNRKGGFGMYYHFDYHGGPISYEWMTSTPFSKTWEQMSMAYDYGIRDIWIVNVGDLKFNEVPLAYFMALAYDFEKWGTNSPNSQKEYTDLWLKKTFTAVDENIREEMGQVLDLYIKLNSIRRPEALNASIYHPCHYLEADRMLNFADNIEKLNENIYNKLDKDEKDAYYSMIYFPAKASVNLLRMHVYAGKNRHYAEQGKPVANHYAELVTQAIENDRSLTNDFASFKNGKWSGMELEQHIGFTRWNDDNYRYPLRLTVEPAHKPRLLVSRKDRQETASKTYGNPMTLKIEDFMYEGNSVVFLEIANDGIGSFDYTIEFDGNQPDWLSVSPMKGTISVQEDITLYCDRTRLTEDPQIARLLIRDGETTVAVVIGGKAIKKNDLPPMTFLENNGIVAIEADHFCEKHDVQKGGFKKLENYGRSGTGMKVFPTTSDFSGNEDKPSLSYRFLSEQAGKYIIEVWTTPTNSVKYKKPLRFLLTDDCGGCQVLETISANFSAGNPHAPEWCEGVLNQIRVTKAKVKLTRGVRTITIGALDAGLVIERVLIYHKEQQPLESYLGPRESYYTR